ncbi:MAG TPA: hypothetical protein VEH29_12670, partial [Acidimicrobiales bacterium]|nr:hypothetical protein [Acidimicrobiales bacterium]
MAKDTWSAIPTAPLAARSGEATVWTGKQMIVWGGEAAYSTSYVVGDLYEPPAYADGAAYNPRTRTWTRLSPAPLSPRYDVASVWDGHAFFVWGGQGGGAAESNTYFADGARYNPTSHRWKRLPPAPLSGRSDATAFWDGSQVVIIGGYGFADLGLVNGATFDPTTNRWRLLPPLPSTAGFYHAPA